MASSSTSLSSSNQRDEVEFRKSLATGSSAPSSPSREAVASIFCYCIASIAMTLVNKFVLSGKGFSMNFLMLAVQSLVCCLLVYLMKKLGFITFRPLTKSDARAWLPISSFLVSVIYTGSKSLQYLSIPVYTIFKNLTIILIAYGEVLWFGGKVTSLTLISFFFMVLSSVIAAWSDVTSALVASEPTMAGSGLSLGSLAGLTGMVEHLNVGYFWMLVNCLTSAAYVLSMRKRIKELKFSDWDSMFYNNFLTIPILVIFSVLMENWTQENLVINFPVETRNFLLSAIAVSGAVAVGISFTTAWCIRVTSSTTYSMVGALNKLPVAASGMVFFHDPVTVASTSAIGVGFFAGLLYAVAKNNQKKDENNKDPVIPLTRKP